MVDPSDHITQFNPALVDMMNLDREMIAKQPCTHIFKAEILELIKKTRKSYQKFLPPSLDCQINALVRL
jgi:hypothetical protein